MRVRYTKDARNQIRFVRAYSQRRWGKEVADLYAQSLRVPIMEIIDQQPSPELNSSADLGEGILSFPCKSHLIYYRLTEYGILVLGVRVLLHLFKEEQLSYFPLSKLTPDKVLA